MVKTIDLNFIKKLVYEQDDRPFLWWLINKVCVLFNNQFSLKIVNKYRNTMMTTEALMNIYLLLKKILDEDLPGDILEVGCHEGFTAILLASVLRNEKSNKKLYLYDSFEGLQNFTKQDEGIYLGMGDCRTSFSNLKKNFKEFRLSLPKVIIGDVEKTISKTLPKAIAFVHLDLDLYSPTFQCLKHIVPRLSENAVIVLDDYGNPAIPGVKKAVMDFSKTKKFEVHSLYSGEYPRLPGLRPSKNGREILKKYQAYFINLK